MKVNLKQKVQICKDLALKLAKNNNDSAKGDLIRTEAEKLNVSPNYVRSTLSTFFETGGKYVDRRCKTGYGTIKMTPTVRAIYPRRTIKHVTAAKIVLEYMTNNKLNSRELANKYKISIVQFYELIKELTNSGTLLGKKIIKINKYSKVIPITDVIWFFKHPDTNRKSITNLTPTQKLSAYTVAEVLKRKLTNITK